jgi:hypothetical protein
MPDALCDHAWFSPKAFSLQPSVYLPEWLQKFLASGKELPTRQKLHSTRLHHAQAL